MGTPRHGCKAWWPARNRPAAFELSRWGVTQCRPANRFRRASEEKPMILSRILPATFAAAFVLFAASSPAAARDEEFTQNEVVVAASGFFGTTTEAVAKAVQRVFSDNGLPDAYILSLIHISEPTRQAEIS